MILAVPTNGPTILNVTDPILVRSDGSLWGKSHQSRPMLDPAGAGPCGAWIERLR
jgi:hypothetical protein